MSSKKGWSIKNFEASDSVIGSAFIFFAMMVFVILTNNPMVTDFEGMILIMVFIIGAMLFFIGIGTYLLIAKRLKKK